MQDWIAPVVAAGLALVALVLGAALLRARSRTDREVATARAETAALRTRLEELERQVAGSDRPGAPETDAEVGYVITDLGTTEQRPLPAPQAGGGLFADLVLRETAVKAVSLAHGVRRALDAETRNRIRFEMKREIRRARKQRRTDTRQAVRERQARQRAELDEEGSAA